MARQGQSGGHYVRVVLGSGCKTRESKLTALQVPLYIGPTAADDPPGSTLNFPSGDDRANAVTVALGPGSTLGVTFVTSHDGPTAQVIFDLTGYFTQ